MTDPHAHTEIAAEAPPRDTRGRPLHDLRISVMDRCNFRCPYCMPESTYGEHYRFLGNDERLSFDEIERIARLAGDLGVSKLRLTGGEPLLRPKLAELVARLRVIPGITDLAMTTNGVLLTRHARDLRAAGLDRVTVSLDTLDPALFHRMSGGRGALDEVLAGIEAAQAAGFPQGVKLNTVVQRGVNEHSVLDVIGRFRGTGIVPRLIEYMDVGNRNDWNREAVVPSAELIAAIDARWPLDALPAKYPGEVATRFRFRDGQGEIGTISSVSQPFCGGCSRARLSSDGTLYTCLFAVQGTDLRAPLRDGSSDDVLRERLRQVWLQRADRYSEEREERRQRSRPKIEMHYIGG
ncbi:molybdenum cofactor biosynthesis protein MoeA [Dyella thiooxydans]|uniref:GTP 3',8-cyclase n=1 Tax=Dyella thiooxydans TaxID=445710 RepID=A0A160MZ00_9GAMM|nr:GTP 3',8-cyclase MoaA [Dyella thiooxydans]AND68526.1 molybdenum cofactor biosynthesis protein MoeA [Dyella thiooxydans]